MGMVGHLRDVFVVAPASFHSQQQHHHHNHEQYLSEQAAAALHSNANAHAHAHAPHNNAATALGVGVIPLLTTAPCLAEDLDAATTRRIGGVHLWQNPMQAHPNYMKKQVNDASGSDANADILNVNNSGSGIGIGTTTCQDCGNQAKKDCSHRRCRTCCKSRGFDCSTHVKSTWVPAARRRERQLSAATAAAAVGSTASTSALKKPRLISSQTLTSASHTSTSNTTPPRSFDTSSSHQDASFRENLPGHVRAPAVFKCVRVTAVDNGEDEYAYQAVVKIGGHIFKGFLYDQGVEGRDGLPNISDLHLGGPGGGRNEASSSLFPVLDPSDVYAAASGGGMLGGTFCALFQSKIWLLIWCLNRALILNIHTSQNFVHSILLVPAPESYPTPD